MDTVVIEYIVVTLSLFGSVCAYAHWAQDQYISRRAR